MSVEGMGFCGRHRRSSYEAAAVAVAARRGVRGAVRSSRAFSLMIWMGGDD